MYDTNVQPAALPHDVYNFSTGRNMPNITL